MSWEFLLRKHTMATCLLPIPKGVLSSSPPQYNTTGMTTARKGLRTVLGDHSLDGIEHDITKT